MKIIPSKVTVHIGKSENDAVLQEVSVALLPRADEVGAGRLLLHGVDVQEQKDSALPAIEGASKLYSTCSVQGDSGVLLTPGVGLT